MKPFKLKYTNSSFPFKSPFKLDGSDPDTVKASIEAEKLGGSVTDSVRRPQGNSDMKVISNDEQKIIDMRNAIASGQKGQNDKVYDTVKRRVGSAMQGNALARLFTGIKNLRG